MATIVNSRDIALQATIPRINTTTLPPNVNIPDSTPIGNTTVGTMLSNLADKLTASSSYTLLGVVTPQNTGAIKLGTITWDPATGALTGGSGIAITEGGLVGAKAGVSQFSIGIDGTATFAGALSAATGTFAGTLSAATGTFSGNLSAAGGTFSGNLSAAGGTFSGTLSGVDGTFSGTLSSGAITGSSTITITGDAKFSGKTTSTIAATIGGTAYSVDYSSYSEGITNATSSSTVRAGAYGYASAATSAYNIGILGKGAGTTNGIGVVGDGDWYGGYFSGKYGIVCSGSTKGITINSGGMDIASGSLALASGSITIGSVITLASSGSITASGNITAYSDVRLKSNIQKLENPFTILNNISGYRYIRKDTKKEDIGLIANELELVLKEAVCDSGLSWEDIENIKTVDYSKLIPVLVEAVKYLYNRVDA